MNFLPPTDWNVPTKCQARTGWATAREVLETGHGRTQRRAALENGNFQARHSGNAPALAAGWVAAPLDNVAELVDTVHRLAESAEHDAAADAIFDRFDAWACAGQWGFCDEALAKLDPQRLTSFELSAVLAITVHFAERLKLRHAFFTASHARIAASKGEKYAEELLSRLRARP